MNKLKLDEHTLPSLYQKANNTAIKSEARYFQNLAAYAVLLVIAALISFFWPTNIFGAVTDLILFIITLSILIYLEKSRLNNTWFNGRSVAESVKTRSWRWCMGAEPYSITNSLESVSEKFTDDLKTILQQNQQLSIKLDSSKTQDDISETMILIRSLSLPERLKIYSTQRIDDQADWYSKKAAINKKHSRTWFYFSVGLHVIILLGLVFKLFDPVRNIPTSVYATAAGVALTWLQAKKHNELSTSYSLAAQEISLIKNEGREEELISSEARLSEFILNSEAAFSREHTQWFARKSNS